MQVIDNNKHVYFFEMRECNLYTFLFLYLIFCWRQGKKLWKKWKNYYVIKFKCNYAKIYFYTRDYVRKSIEKNLVCIIETIDGGKIYGHPSHSNSIKVHDSVQQYWNQ